MIDYRDRDSATPADGPYTIRLAGPWQRTPLARTRMLPDGTTAIESADANVAELPAASRVPLPDDWTETLPSGFRGRVRYVRRFGRPTNLGDQQRVELVIEAIDVWASLTLNERPLTEPLCGRVVIRIDVTSQLLPRNELVIDVELPRVDAASAPLPFQPGDRLRPGLWARVRLEIFE